MRLDDWNRYRHNTYKDNPDAEEPFIPHSELIIHPTPAHAADKEEPERPPVYAYFTFLKKGTHTINQGKTYEKVVSAE